MVGPQRRCGGDAGGRLAPPLRPCGAAAGCGQQLVWPDLMGESWSAGAGVSVLSDWAASARRRLVRCARSGGRTSMCARSCFKPLPPQLGAAGPAGASRFWRRRARSGLTRVAACRGGGVQQTSRPAKKKRANYAVQTVPPTWPQGAEDEDEGGTCSLDVSVASYGLRMRFPPVLSPRGAAEPFRRRPTATLGMSRLS